MGRSVILSACSRTVLKSWYAASSVSTEASSHVEAIQAAERHTKLGIHRAAVRQRELHLAAVPVRLYGENQIGGTAFEAKMLHRLEQRLVEE
jgi:hypothetical protein